MDMTPRIRRAERAERDRLHDLQHSSMRVLGRAWYDADVIEAVITHVGTMDDALLDDGTYFLVEIGDELVGCGGWSMRTPNYAPHVVDQTATRLPQQAATIRSIFVHPAWARRGFMRRLMADIEGDVLSAGIGTAALTATLTGIPFYRRLGYRAYGPAVLTMPGDLVFVGLNMAKPLHAQSAELAQAA